MDFGFAVPPLAEIMPVEIRFFDQRDLLFSTPFLQLLLAIDRIANIVEGFVVHKSAKMKMTGEAFAQFLAMHPEALGKLLVMPMYKMRVALEMI